MKYIEPGHYRRSLNNMVYDLCECSPAKAGAFSGVAPDGVHPYTNVFQSFVSSGRWDYFASSVFNCPASYSRNPAAKPILVLRTIRAF